MLKVFSNSNHPLHDVLFNLKLLSSTSDKFNLRGKFSLLIAFIDMYKKNHIYKSDIMLSLNYNLNSVLIYPQIDTISGSDIKKSKSPNDSFNNIFKNASDHNFNFYTDTSNKGHKGCGSGFSYSCRKYFLLTNHEIRVSGFF